MNGDPHTGAPPDIYVLRATLTSPYGRKVRIAVDVLGLADRIRLVPADTLDAGDSLRQQNPLGKMPCLLLADGTALYDSRVIVEFLQEQAGTERLLPARGEARYRALTRAALADGIADAALLMVYERRFRPDGPWSERWLDHQRGKVRRGLAAFAEAPPDPLRTDLVSIGLACALAYLDWRQPVSWRPDFPALAGWLDAFAAHEPAFGRSFPSEPTPTRS
ncbi:glutathione S-transferase [Thalassobaculum fulvum]|uniref:Glutathione S-transferase n=1 Tax=Thalassobaculum fulvum TaxID=1633335 RepID=A0A918XU91_9PROT|nr:glutathione S-transferase family protein [Thalassobaculum fulvum]GHD54287.1 glutathione S-transferase [Thalassobaculum fulvum]